MRKNFVYFFMIFVSLALISSSEPIYQDNDENLQSRFQPLGKYKELYYGKTGIQEEENLPEKVLSITEISNIEKSFLERSKTFISVDNDEYLTKRLKQFGYEFFEKKPVSPFTPVGKDYVVGPGDQINIYLWGDPVDILGLQGFYSFEVDRDGKIYIPNLGVFYVWGLSLDKIKKILRKSLSKKFKNFEVDVTLGKLRKYPVYVTGFVNNPGIIMVQGNASLLDVLSLAGGVSKDGSLRNIILRRRKNGRTIEKHIDLYDFFAKGIPVDVDIKENDSIYVPAIGKVVAIAGGVKREGIYELKDEKTIKDIINLAGGLLPSVNIKGVKINRIKNNGFIVDKISVSSMEKTSIEDGDFIYIEHLNNFIDRKIEVKGHIKYPGVYPFKENYTLKKLINYVGLLPDTNLYYGEILRKITNTNRYEVINFVPLEIIHGIKDIKLKNQDIVSFYPDWIYKPIVVSGFIKNPVVVPYYKGIRLLDVIRNVKLNVEPRKIKAEIYRKKGETEKVKIEVSSKTIGDNDIATREEFERTVYLYDLLIKGDEKSNILLEPGDKVLLKITEDTEKDKTVTLLGEVKHPGIYKYKTGMRLYDIIKEAGGYTKDAYPRGIIFIRKSAKNLQEQQLKLSMLALEENLSKSEEGIGAVGATAEEQKVLQMTIQKQKQLLSILQKKAQLGLGRIALNIPNSLEELKNSPDNIELSDGDYIYIPSKPNYVLVLGGVYNQISLPYRKNLTVKDYLEQVGGLKDNADIDDIYIIKANGRVLSKKQFASINFVFVKYNSFLQYKPEQGDAIVVPTKLKVPIMWRPLLRDITQIIFQSISTAVLAKRL